MVDLKAEEINYLADADIINGYYKLLDDRYGLDSFEIKINVMPDIVNFTGSGNVSGANVNFEGKQILEGVQIVDEIEGKINIESSALVNFVPQEYFENSSGSLPIRFSFIKVILLFFKKKFFFKIIFIFLKKFFPYFVSV